MTAKENDPRYVPGVSDLDDDMTDAELTEAYGDNYDTILALCDGYNSQYQTDNYYVERNWNFK